MLTYPAIITDAGSMADSSIGLTFSLEKNNTTSSFQQAAGRSAECRRRIAGRRSATCLSAREPVKVASTVFDRQVTGPIVRSFASGSQEQSWFASV